MPIRKSNSKDEIVPDVMTSSTPTTDENSTQSIDILSTENPTVDSAIAGSPTSAVIGDTIDSAIEQIVNGNDPTLISYSPPPADRLTIIEIKYVIDFYARKHNLTYAETIHSITYWCQSGGYIKAVPDRKAKINRKSDEELRTLRLAVASVRPNGTVRQLARGFAHIIYRLALKYGYIGHLWKEFKSRDATLSTNDAYLACEYYDGCDFTPVKVQNVMNDRNLERKKFRSAGKPGGKGKKGPKKR